MIIKTEKLLKLYRTAELETTALNQVDLEVDSCDFLAIMGPSGCGKSTLLNILALLDKPSAGEYILNNVNTLTLNEKQSTLFRRHNIGMIFQNFNLIEELTVYENVMLPLVYQNIKTAERKERTNLLLKRMNLLHRAKHYPNQLSGGQQQRAAVARAIITNPFLLLADEPTGNLDSKNGVDVMTILSELNQEGTTIVMVTHSLRDASFAKRTIQMNDGCINM